jgi:hypothetical protein
LDMLLSNPVEPNTATVSVESTVSACTAVAPKTTVRVSGLERNSVALDGGLSSMNSIAPTKIAVIPGELAKAGIERGDTSIPTACMVIGNALAKGVTVARAIAPCTV